MLFLQLYILRINVYTHVGKYENSRLGVNLLMHFNTPHLHALLIFSDVTLSKAYLPSSKSNYLKITYNKKQLNQKPTLGKKIYNS